MSIMYLENKILKSRCSLLHSNIGIASLSRGSSISKALKNFPAFNIYSYIPLQRKFQMFPKRFHSVNCLLFVKYGRDAAMRLLLPIKKSYNLRFTIRTTELVTLMVKY